MFKIIVVAVLVAAVYLFAPQYNLYEKESSFSDRYVLREKGFWSQKDCRAAGVERDNPFQCRTTSAWREMMGKQSDYNRERPMEPDDESER